ncbi:MAG: hypothetical protein P8O04_00730 [Flavobacteriaceae bacterium]|nr:hypothetical protein [Flavobacteriaceae bacterium]
MMNKDAKDPLYERFAKAYTVQAPPSGHEQRFITKLSSNKVFKRRRLSFRVAAMVLILLGFGATLGGNSRTAEEEAFYQTETYFQSMVANQLEALPKNEPHYSRPIAAAQTQLARLQKQYNRQMERFQKGTKHPKLLRALIENLQKQLEIVETLTQQIEIINTEKNEMDNL